MAFKPVSLRFPNHAKAIGQGSTGYHSRHSFRKIDLPAWIENLCPGLAALLPDDFRPVTVPPEDDLLWELGQYLIDFPATEISDHAGQAQGFIEGKRMGKNSFLEAGHQGKILQKANDLRRY